MPAIDEIIGRWVKQVEETGELRRSRLFGKPLELDDGFEQTPTEQRMAHKVLKNAGYVPAEVQAMQRIAELKEELDAATSEADRMLLRRKLAEAQQKLSLRLERARR